MLTLENYYFPGELERVISEFVDYYNNQRYQASLNNITPADVFYGRDEKILSYREFIKEQTLIKRRSQNLKNGGKRIVLDYEKCLP